MNKKPDFVNVMNETDSIENYLETAFDNDIARGEIQLQIEYLNDQLKEAEKINRKMREIVRCLMKIKCEHLDSGYRIFADVEPMTFKFLKTKKDLADTTQFIGEEIAMRIYRHVMEQNEGSFE